MRKTRIVAMVLVFLMILPSLMNIIVLNSFASEPDSTDAQLHEHSTSEQNTGTEVDTGTETESALPDPREHLSYTFTSDADCISVLDFLRAAGIATESIDSAVCENAAIRIMYCISDYRIQASGYFDGALLEVTTHEGEKYSISLHYPEPEAKIELEDGVEIRYEDLVIVSGRMPRTAVLSVVPAMIDIDGEKVLVSYDIKVYADEKQLEKGNVWQPAPGEKVKVSIRFDAPEKEEVNVYHIAGDSDPEYVATADIGDNWVTFDAESFSVYALTRTIKKVIKAGDGNSYLITVKFDDDANIPEDAVLKVTELKDSEYGFYLEQTLRVMNAASFDSARIFDISITDGVGDPIEPAAPVQVGITLNEDAGKGYSVVHFSDGAELMSSSMKNETVLFETNGFSIYSIVAGPALIVPSAVTVETLQELSDNFASNYFALSVTRSSTVYYFKSDLNGKNAFIESTASSEAAKWHFEKVGGYTNRYMIYFMSGGNKLYMQRGNGVEMGLNTGSGTAFDISEVVGQTSQFYFKVADEEYWLQHSGSGNGIRLYGDKNNAANCIISITYSSSFNIPDDAYGLSGAEYGLMNYRNGTSAYALMAEGYNGGSTNLVSKQMYIRQDPLNMSGTLFVANNSDISMWRFISISADKYYITCGGQYLRIGSSSVSLVNTPDDQCVILVVPGTGSNEGKIRLIGEVSNKVLAYNSNKFSSVTQSYGVGEWLSFACLSVYGDEDFVPYLATKVSVSDQVNVTNGTQIIIYTRVWNETNKSYEFYAVDQNGMLVPCYESGGSITWIGTRINTLLWDFIEYYNAGGAPNNYYDIYNSYSGLYIAPQIRDGQILTNSPLGVNLDGRKYGEYYTSIYAWDDPYYDYASVRTQAGMIASTTMSGAEHFYFAVMQLSTPGTPTPVETVDHSNLGLIMKMKDFTGAIVQGGGSNSPTTQIQLDYIGTQLYSVGAVQPGLLSTDLSGGVTGYPTGTITGLSLAGLFSGATEVNHLFIQSIFDGSGYYEFDSTQNFAHLNGTNFEVYRELGTVSGSSNTRKHGQFMPYNTLDMSKASTANPYNLTDIYGRDLSDNIPRKKETLFGLNEVENYYFGMEIEGHFLQPPSGCDAWGHDMIFEFVGDDDFWMYIDGELVIDLGGIHQALPGSVNYRTGKVILNNTETTLYDIYRSNYVARGLSDGEISAKLNDIFKEVTISGQPCHVFKDYSTHTIRIFYMERGGGASNLRMRFNLATVTPGQVLLSKEISGTDKQDYTSVKFPFQIFFDNDGSGYNQLTQDFIVQSNKWRVAYYNTSTPVEYASSVVIDGVTYDNVFYLKPGQTAAITVPDNTITYYIRECGVNTDIYDYTNVNSDPAIDDTPPGAVNTSCWKTSEESVANRAKVVFENHVDPSNLRTFTITKRLFDESGNELTAAQDNTGFRLRLYLGESLEYYSMGEYHVKDPNGYYCTYIYGMGFVSTGVNDFDSLSNEQKARSTFITSPSGAADKLPAQYSIEIRDLLVGTRFKVVEESFDIPIGYGMRTWEEDVNGTPTEFTCYKRVAGSYIVGEGDTQNSGYIRDNSNPSIEVHNQRGFGIRADKTWSDSDFMRYNAYTYFALFIDDSTVPVANSVRRIDSYNYATWYMPSLEPGKDLSNYHVYEVELTDPGFDGNGNVTYTSLTKIYQNDTVILGGGVLKNGLDSGPLTYRVHYTPGTVMSSVGTLENIRTDIVRNNRLGGLTIIKTDMSGVGIPGAEFSLCRSDSSPIGSYTSDTDGMVTSLYLDDGTYTLTELKAPKGYLAISGSFTITVSSGSFSVSESGTSYAVFDSVQNILTVKNKSVTFRAVKTDSESNALENAHFALYRQIQGVKDYYPMTGCADLITDVYGIIPGITQMLNPGTYYLTETEAPAGYDLLDADICFSINELGEISLISGPCSSLDLEDVTGGIAVTLAIRNTSEPSFNPTGYYSEKTSFVYMLCFGCALTAITFLIKSGKNKENRAAARYRNIK